MENSTRIKLLGWPADELLGKHYRTTVHEEDRHFAERKFRVLGSDRTVTDLECRLISTDGSHRWVHWNATPIPGENRIYAVGRDVTERRASEQRVTRLLDSAPDAMVVVNEAGDIQLVNAQTEELFGYAREELLGQPVTLLIPERFREAYPRQVARFVNNASVRPTAGGLALYGRHKDGTEFRFEISLSPLETEDGVLLSGAIRLIHKT